MAVSSVCVVCAVWMRAPGLDVELPLGGETKMSLNVGYVVASVVMFALGTRLLVLFVLPTLAFLFIANVYFLDLHVFDAARFESKRRLRLPEHFFGLGAQPASG
jgi:hypothetical protein